MSQGQFRIGGVYRCNDGVLVRLRRVAFWSDRDEMAQAVVMDGGAIRGARRLMDGAYPFSNNPRYGGNLLPGELHQVNGQWVAVEDKPASVELTGGWGTLIEGRDFDRPATKTPTLDKLERAATLNTTEMEKARPRLTWADSKPVDRFPDFIVKCDTGFQDDDGPLHKLQRTAAIGSHLLGGFSLKG